MHSHDHIMGPRRELSDLLNDAGRYNSFGGWGAHGAADRRTEDRVFDHTSRSLADDRTAAGDPRADAYSFWPTYHPYQPEMPPPARYEPPVPPPATFIPEPQPETVRYEDGLMSQALFDWSMRNLPQPSAAPLDDWI
jgi:hypothetical protein